MHAAEARVACPHNGTSRLGVNLQKLERIHNHIPDSPRPAPSHKPMPNCSSFLCGIHKNRPAEGIQVGSNDEGVLHREKQGRARVCSVIMQVRGRW